MKITGIMLFVLALLLGACSKEKDNEVVRPVAAPKNAKAPQADKMLGFGNRLYFIRSASFPKVVDLEAASCNAGRNISLYDYHGGWNQQWYIMPANDGTGAYYISSPCGKYMDLSYGACNLGQNVQLWDFNGSSAQKWYIFPAGGGYFHIMAACGMYLDAVGFTPYNSQNIQVWSYNGGYWNQKWYFTPV